MRKFFHNLFPHFIDSGEEPRTDLDRLVALIAQQRTLTMEARVKAIAITVDAEREEQFLARLEALLASMVPTLEE